MKKVIFVSKDAKEFHNGDTVTISNKTFEICKPITSNNIYINTRDIYDCYSNPSVYKKSIYEQWAHWFIHERNCFRFGVSSYNCMQFSISALTWVEELGCECYLHITKAHNYLSPVYGSC